MKRFSVSIKTLGWLVACAACFMSGYHSLRSTYHDNLNLAKKNFEKESIMLSQFKKRTETAEQRLDDIWNDLQKLNGESFAYVVDCPDVGIITVFQNGELRDFKLDHIRFPDAEYHAAVLKFTKKVCVGNYVAIVKWEDDFSKKSMQAHRVGRLVGGTTILRLTRLDNESLVELIYGHYHKLNRTLVRKGWARASGPEYEDAELSAQNRKVGMWFDVKGSIDLEAPSDN